MKNNTMQYAENDTIDGDLTPQETKVKVTIYLDGDLLLEIRRCARKHGKKYQTYINEALREQFLRSNKTVDVEEFRELAHRVATLEKAMASE